MEGEVQTKRRVHLQVKCLYFLIDRNQNCCVNCEVRREVAVSEGWSLGWNVGGWLREWVGLILWKRWNA